MTRCDTLLRTLLLGYFKLRCLNTNICIVSRHLSAVAWSHAVVRVRINVYFVRVVCYSLNCGGKLYFVNI